MKPDPIVLSAVSVLVAASVLALGNPAAGQELTAEERTLVAEAFALHAALADDLWPGWGETPLPLVLVTEETEFGIGFDRLLEGATAIAPLGNRSVCARPRTLGANLAASFFVEGIPAAVLGTPEAIGDRPTRWIVTALHEMFHVLQMARGSVPKVAALEIGPEDDPSWQLDYPFPYDSGEVMAAVHTLGYCLYLAMTAESASDRNYAAGTGEDARVALEAVRRAAAGAFRPSAAFLALPGAEPFDELWSESYEARTFLVKHAGRAARSRSVFYHLGFGFASVLEQLEPGWKRSYFDTEAWVDGLLAESVAKACEVPAAP